MSFFETLENTKHRSLWIWCIWKSRD